MLSPSPCTALRMGSTANSGSVPMMMSRISRRAGGTGVGRGAVRQIADAAEELHHHVA